MHERNKCEHLFVLVTNLSADDPIFRELVDHSVTYEEFRLALAIDQRVSPSAEIIYKQWTEDVTARLSVVDLNQLMHSIEKVVAKQAELDLRMLSVEKGYLDAMNQADSWAGEIKAVALQSQELRELVSRYRHQIASTVD